MAGIGFELRKIFKKNSIYNQVKGVAFATMTIIGPTIIFLFMLLCINVALNYFGASEIEQIFFSSACLYIFLFSIILSGSTGTVITRFISDKIHDNDEKSIPSAMVGTTVFVSIIASVFAGCCCGYLYLFEGVNIYFAICLYFLSIMMSITYNVMIFVAALKEYAKISLSFLIGISMGIATFFLCYLTFDVLLLEAILTGMVTAFLLINLIIIYLVKTFFPETNTNYFEFLHYFKKHPLLFWSGLLYITTLYIPNVIFWYFSDISLKISIFRVAPSYDMAMFLALMINLTAPVIFVVKVETKFFEKYQNYVGSLLNGTYNVIEKYRQIMVRTLVIELFFIYEVQLIITIILTCVGILFLPMLGFGGLVLNFFLVLGIAVYCTFLMYFTIVFLYYFDDQLGSVLTTLTFSIVTLISTLIVLKLGVSYYPLALLAGGIAGWIAGFFRLRYFVKTVNSRLFCKDIE